MTQNHQSGASPTAATRNSNPAPQSPTLRLLLICQAEGMHSRYSELSTEDSGLTARGWEQTNVLASWLAAHEKIDLLICAPQLRSRLTAQRIGQAIGRPVIVQPEMPHHPRSFATLRGNKFDAPAHYPPLHIDEQFDNESLYEVFRRRMVTMLEGIVDAHVGKRVAVVLDGNGVATALRICLGAATVSMAVNHTSIAELQWESGRWCLLYTNRMEHIPQPILAQSGPSVEPLAAADSKAIQEELDQITQVYNRVLASAGNLNDQGRDQRLRHLLKFANLPAGHRILDVGTGNGRLALMLAEDGAREVVGIDISPAMLEMAEYLRASSMAPSAQRVNYRLASAHSLPFRSDGFDVAVCRLVVHHSHQPDAIIRELYRLLRPGGLLILADLLAADDPVRRATQNTIESRRNPSHVAIYTADQYRKMVGNAGFSIENDTVAIFERDMEDWLSDLQCDPANRPIVREMIEAGLETDATGLKVRQQGGKLIFDQRLLYVRAVKQ